MDWIKNNNNNNNNNNKIITTVSLATLAAILIKYYYQNNNQNRLSKFNQITLEKIIIYPVKSCKGIEVKSCKLTKYGFENDRRWMIIKDNRYISMKPYPIMGTITPRFSSDGKQLIITKEGMEDLIISAEPLDVNKMESSRIYNQVSLIDNVAQVYDEGDVAADWFNRAMNAEGMRLVQMCPPSIWNRSIRGHMAENVDPNDLNKFKNSLANSCQLMVLGQSSIDLLNEKINQTRVDNGEIKQEPLTWSRFRPNLLLSGTSAFQEDEWRSFQSNSSNIKFTVCDFNGRCPIVLVNDKGIMDPFNDDEPLRTLRTFRAAKCKLGDKVLMGVYCVIQDQYINKVISVGESISILQDGLTSKYFNKLF